MTSENSEEIKSPIQCGYTSPRSISQYSSSPYKKVKESKQTFVAFVNAVKDSLNLHLDIYWPAAISDKYENAMKYEYSFVSEELPETEFKRMSYHCHLRGIEIVSDSEYSANSKIVYNFLMQNIVKQGGWILVSVGDIDVYQRILVNIFNIVTRKSINKEILQLVSPKTNKPIAKEYIRQTSGKKQFVAHKQEFHFVR